MLSIQQQQHCICNSWMKIHCMVGITSSMQHGRKNGHVMWHYVTRQCDICLCHSLIHTIVLTIIKGLRDGVRGEGWFVFGSHSLRMFRDYCKTVKTIHGANLLYDFMYICGTFKGHHYIWVYLSFIWQKHLEKACRLEVVFLKLSRLKS